MVRSMLGLSAGTGDMLTEAIAPSTDLRSFAVEPHPLRRRLLRYGYPPDQQPEAIERVLKQTEAKAEEWA